MPAEGTKRIEINGRETFVPAAEAEIDELVREGLRLELAIASLKEPLDAIKERLAAIANQKRESEEVKSVNLVAPSGAGAALVVFGNTITVQTEGARDLEQRLPKEIFSTIFSSKTTFGLAPGYTSFMNSAQAPEIQRLKLAAAKLVEVKPKRPAVKLTAMLALGDEVDDG